MRIDYLRNKPGKMMRCFVVKIEGIWCHGLPVDCHTWVAICGKPNFQKFCNSTVNDLKNMYATIDLKRSY